MSFKSLEADALGARGPLRGSGASLPRRTKELRIR